MIYEYFNDYIFGQCVFIGRWVKMPGENAVFKVL